MAREWSLSVALVTRNRQESLKRTLHSLRAQTTQPYEVIVSDDSDDGGADAVRGIAHAYGARYLAGPRRGLYANRNWAIATCGGTHVRTMDDDHEFPDGHFAACAEALETDPEAVWIIGEFLPDEPVGGPVVCPPQLHPRGFSVAPPDPDRCWSMADGAAVFPRAIFDQGVRYAEFFPFGAVYLELGSRLHWLGFRIRHLAGTYVIHHLDPANRSYDDKELDAASRVFAMFCHSIVYQPRARNRALTAFELVRVGVRQPQAVLRGFTAFRDHRAALEPRRIRT